LGSVALLARVIAFLHEEGDIRENALQGTAMTYELDFEMFSIYSIRILVLQFYKSLFPVRTCLHD
jgi:hypothetical protein